MGGYGGGVKREGRERERWSVGGREGRVERRGGTNEESSEGENVSLMGRERYKHDDDVNGVVDISC